MCGISGTYGDFDSSVTKLMVGALNHRGPDGDGIFTNDDLNISLGHNRLSIIDLSVSASQPMTDKSGRYTIVYNGEIYNYEALRKELSSLGYVFTSTSDTEVVLYSFMEWGVKSLNLLRGMFAFSIFDSNSLEGPAVKNNKGLPEEPYLFLARDRFGIKPLLYSRTKQGFVFASELKALFASGTIERIIDNESLAMYLQTGSVYQPRTLIKGVAQLPAASYMIVGDSNKTVEINSYWNIVDDTKDLKSELKDIPYDELVVMVGEKFDDAIKAHMVSDVPVGAFLSGGVDSTAIVAFMSRYVKNPIKSFTVGFSETGEVTDELSYAKEASDFIGCDHSEVIISADDIKYSIDDLIEALDQPSMDGTNTFMVSRAAGSDVKVALSGLGGDELFAGYGHFLSIDRAFKSPPLPLDGLFSFLHSYRPNIFTMNAALRGGSRSEAVLRFRSLFSQSFYKLMFNEGNFRKLPSSISSNFLRNLERKNLDIIDQVSFSECEGYMKSTLLRDSDAVSMFNSLELRPVFLDHELAELAFSLPGSAKIKGGVFKSVLVDAVKDYIPESTYNRKKVGFELPLSTWMNSVLKTRIENCLTTDLAKKLFSEEFTDYVKKSLNAGKLVKNFWAIFILLEWVERFDIKYEEV